MVRLSALQRLLPFAARAPYQMPMAQSSTSSGSILSAQPQTKGNPWLPKYPCTSHICADGLRSPCPYPVSPSTSTPNTLHDPSRREYPARAADRIPRRRLAACDVRGMNQKLKEHAQ
jgi:hypothetical protein